MLTLRDFYTGKSIKEGTMFVLQRPDFNAFGSYHDTIAVIAADSVGEFQYQFRHDSSLLVAYEAICTLDDYPPVGNFRVKKGCSWVYDLRLKPLSKLRLTIENSTTQAVSLGNTHIYYTSPSGGNAPPFIHNKQYIDDQNISDTLAPGTVHTFIVKSLPEETLHIYIQHSTNKRLERSFTTNRDSLNSLKIRLE